MGEGFNSGGIREKIYKSKEEKLVLVSLLDLYFELDTILFSEEYSTLDETLRIPVVFLYI